MSGLLRRKIESERRSLISDLIIAKKKPHSLQDRFDIGACVSAFDSFTKAILKSGFDPINDTDFLLSKIEDEVGIYVTLTKTLKVFRGDPTDKLWVYLNSRLNDVEKEMGIIPMNF